MQQINPNDFVFPPELVRKTMNLSENALIIPWGYEDKYPTNIKNELISSYDFASMLVRGVFDYIVVDANNYFFVECKEDARAVEAFPLLINKMMFDNNKTIPIFYCFSDNYVHVKDMPMEKILVPLQHAKKFKESFEPWFIDYGVSSNSFIYLTRLGGGSGDPFVLNDKIPRKKLEGF